MYAHVQHWKWIILTQVIASRVKQEISKKLQSWRNAEGGLESD